jgi:hypothetical protein
MPSKIEKPASSAPSKSKSSPDTLIKKGDVELKEEQLKKVSGGIAGESIDAKHKGE